MTRTFATWNPSDKNANVTLSGGNLTASVASWTTHYAARATIWKSSGKWYWEVTVVSNAWTILIWVGNSLMSIANNSYVGSDINWWAYHINWTKYNNAWATAYGATYANGDVIWVALDMDWGTITMYKNNTSQWTMYSSLTGTLLPAISLYWASSVTANFGETTFTYAPPVWFSWLSTTDIIFNNASFSAGTTGTSHTLAHTCTWSNRLLVVTAYINSSSDLITGITYNGVSMTRINWLNNWSTEGIYMYFILNPSTGTNNVVATTSSSATVIMQNASYTWVAQTWQPNVSGTSTYSTRTTLQTNVTTTLDNCWTVGIMRTGANMTALAGTTLRTWVNATLQIADSNWPKTPAGSTSIGVTLSSAPSASIVASFAPFVSFIPRITII